MLGDMPFNFLFYLVFARRTEMNMEGIYGLVLNFELEKHIFPGGSGEFCLAKYTAVYDFILRIQRYILQDIHRYMI